MKRREPLTLTDTQLRQLSHWSCTAHGDTQLGRRAKIIMLAADGVSNAEIVRRVCVSRQTVVTWIKRFRLLGVDGLIDAPRSGRPRTVDEARVIAWTLEPPPWPEGTRRWSTRTLASALGVSNAQVSKVWRRWGIRDGYVFDTDPPFRPTLRYLLGVYLDSRTRAMVLSADQSPPGPPVAEAARGASPAATSERVHAIGDLIESVPIVGPATGPTAPAGLSDFLRCLADPDVRRPLRVVVDTSEQRPALLDEIPSGWRGDVQVHYADHSASWHNMLRVFLWVHELRCERFGRVTQLPGLYEKIADRRSELVPRSARLEWLDSTVRSSEASVVGV
ncbi:transposase [Saccharopolyspora lacisalsi]|uniref:Transposase n=1 Tax=Halosaccharopolyspora lacisalsi TaxID=1000566 RepID=A0A839E3R6_9PSEU|nr:helix-turn-helix domain-containing protein [Halosaccharopolyspora lacisalsi]MBA8827509.1 transposase [Halosaccharopolyspora lacisalsi]